MERRTFLKNTFGVSALALVHPQLVFASTKKDIIKLGVIGTGMRGRSLLGLFLDRDDVKVTALCDVDKDALERAQKMVVKAGKDEANLFSDGAYAYKAMLDRDDVDAVIIATPWTWHAPMAVDAMEAGKYVGLEVCGATSLEECWSMVRAHERTGAHLMIMENVMYRRDIMAITNMVKQGVFGELIHLEGGYQHDLRHVKFNDGINPYGGGVEFGDKGYSEAKWRTGHSVNRNGDLYPTHGLGPVGNMVDLNRGNRMISLTSTSSKARGLHKYIVDNGGEDHPNANVKFNLGDVVTTVIKTQNGESILLSHDTNLPRPYSLGFRVQGTEGIWMAVNKSIYIEGKSPSHRWEDAAPYLKEYDHPLWIELEEKAAGAGHGGMDYFVVNAFVEAVKRETAPPMDVYDAAAWAAVTPMSEASIAAGGAPMYFPDFTNGKWMNK